MQSYIHIHNFKKKNFNVDTLIFFYDLISNKTININRENLEAVIATIPVKDEKVLTEVILFILFNCDMFHVSKLKL